MPGKFSVTSVSALSLSFRFFFFFFYGFGDWRDWVLGWMELSSTEGRARVGCLEALEGFRWDLGLQVLQSNTNG